MDDGNGIIAGREWTANKASGESASLMSADDVRPERIEPDLAFKQLIAEQAGATFEKCFQCGTCSATCEVSPDTKPFPRKEMIWAVWGMKERLVNDPDIWLCYQCHDCSTRCPRGARPGDVLAAVRQECIAANSYPSFLGRWVNRPEWLPLLLAVPTILLTVALVAKEPLEKVLGLAPGMDDRISYAYTNLFPHWLLNSLFGLLTLLVILATVAGVRRFWNKLKLSLPDGEPFRPIKGGYESLLKTIRNVFVHDHFALCTREHGRLWSHLMLFFGFLGLTLVTLWVITSSINPLIGGNFVYPFGFWSPWKLVANLSGLAVLVGCFLMIRQRLTNDDQVNGGSYPDWILLGGILVVVASGFATEILHYVRLEPHRQMVYFVHLVFVFALLLYLPYSKLAHLVYRTAARVFAEQTGRFHDANAVTRREEESQEEAPHVG